MEFKPWPKTPRFSRDIVITEKIDGTNAQITILPASTPEGAHDAADSIGTFNNFIVWAGSRTRWIQPGKTTDNYGFAAWVCQNVEELLKLGPGSHFGEWWGAGIQRRYGLTEKRFSLFNTNRWCVDNINGGLFEILVNKETKESTFREGPKCCHLVPTLYKGPLDTTQVEHCMQLLRDTGSAAAPGFMDPEGIIIYHTASGQVFKKTCKDDEKAKGQQ